MSITLVTDITRGLLNWKDRREVMQKLASMINSYSPRKIRQSCLGEKVLLIEYHLIF